MTHATNNSEGPEDRSDGHSRTFDLAERTARFGEAAIRFCRSTTTDTITQPILRQLVRAATSVGANYVEADEAGSKKEFRNRISVCKREARETQYWLRMLVAAVPLQRDPARDLWREAEELILILGTIYRKSKPAT
jgi:four helix bundle protein